VKRRAREPTPAIKAAKAAGFDNRLPFRCPAIRAIARSRSEEDDRVVALVAIVSVRLVEFLRIDGGF